MGPLIYHVEMGPLILQQGQRTGRKKRMETNPAREREKREEQTQEGQKTQSRGYRKKKERRYEGERESLFNKLKE
jgi:hypothetical protein